MKTFIMVGLALATVAIFSACNTVRGVGRDVQSAGRGIERSTR